MKYDIKRICEVCGQRKGGFNPSDHSECSVTKQQETVGTYNTTRKKSLKQLDNFAKDVRKYGW